MDRVQAGLDRLNKLLPLAENQSRCSRQSISLHQFLLEHFVMQGGLPADDEMERRFPRWQASLDELSEALLLDRSAAGELRGFYPFTRETREHRVLVNGLQLHCMCALDALAVSPMFNLACQINSVCRLSDQVIEITQDVGGRVINRSPEEIHVAIAWAAADSTVSCAQSLCLEMFFIAGCENAITWRAEAPQDRDTYQLNEAVEFASRFFKPLLQQAAA